MHRVRLILPAGFDVMSYAALGTFGTANFIAGQQFYDLSIVSEHGGPVPNSFGMVTETERLTIKSFDTLLVGASPAPVLPTPKLLSFLREAVTDMRRVASIGVGSAPHLAAELLKTNSHVEPGKRTVAETRRIIEGGWRALADDLAKVGHQDLAREVQLFVERIPPPRTEKELIAARLLVRTRAREHKISR